MQGKKRLVCQTLIAAFMLTAFSLKAEAVPSVASPLLSVFSDSATPWTIFVSEDGNPDARGGQPFDSEYLLYQLNGQFLSIGLQTGYDVIDGNQWSVNGTQYYAGDLALSFDGSASSQTPSSYEYAVDFGLLTKDHNRTRIGLSGNNGTDPAGLYSATSWGGVTQHSSDSDAAPFAMNAGTLVENLSANIAGFEYYQDADGYNEFDQSGNKLYGCYRIVTFDLLNVPGLEANQPFTLNAHWTTSCANDSIYGQFSETVPVPEPTTILLLGGGLLGLAVSGKKKSV